MLESIEQYVEVFSHAHYSLFPDCFFERHKEKIENLIAESESINGFVSVNLSMLNPTKEEMLEIINEDFRRNVNHADAHDILFWDEMKKHIYNDAGCIHPFSENMLQTIKQFGSKFSSVLNDARQTIQKDREIIENGDYSIGLKKLADRYMHESKVSFEIAKPYVIANFGQALYNEPMVCKFRTISEDSFFVFDCEINESEVIINSDGTFQYNALVYCDSNNVHEIHIIFYDVEVEEMEGCNE